MRSLYALYSPIMALKKEEEKLSSIERALARTATLESKLEDLIATLHVKGVKGFPVRSVGLCLMAVAGGHRAQHSQQHD